MRLAAWLATSMPEVCQACQQAKPGLSCAGCELAKPEIKPENYLLWLIIDQFGTYFIDGMGGISASGVKMAISASGIPGAYHGYYLKQIGSFLTQFRKTQHEQQDSNRATKQR